MRKKYIVLISVFSFLMVVILVAGALFLWFTRQAFPKTRGSVVLEGLKAPVEVFRDSDGVPHIYAETMEDLYFAQGFVHAQERFWQMEFFRRLTAGRLSELFGRETKEMDVFFRTLALSGIAEQEYEMLDAEMRDSLDAFSAGVNAYILNRKPAKLKRAKHESQSSPPSNPPRLLERLCSPRPRRRRDSRPQHRLRRQQLVRAPHQQASRHACSC